MKGQVKIEFILGMVVFAVLIFYVASRIDTAFISTNTDTRVDILKARSITILDIVTKDKNNGLAVDTNVLNKTKIIEWENNNCAAIQYFDLGGYRMIIEERDGGELLFCGFVGLTSIRSSIIQPIKIKNQATGEVKYGNITLEMW